MSLMGTGVAAAVAQTALQAQQVARRRDRRTTATKEEARRVRELFELHLRAVEEGEEAGSASHLHVSGNPPDRPSPEYLAEHGDPGDAAIAGDDAPAPTLEPLDPDAALYRHLDVQA